MDRFAPSSRPESPGAEAAFEPGDLVGRDRRPAACFALLAAAIVLSSILFQRKTA